MTEITTKDKLLDAAEKLFAAKGIAHTSTRDITKEADVNLASINYHFGSREGLVAELLERRVGPINRERVRMLEIANKDSGGKPSVEAILRAFIEPAILTMGKSDEKQNFLAIMGQLHTSPEHSLKELMPRLFGDVIKLFMEAFCQALSPLSPKDVFCRFSFAIGSMIHTLMLVHLMEKNEFVSGLHTASLDLETITEELIIFARKGMLS